MSTTGVAPVKQAVVRALRDNTALKAMVGADGINEGISPRDSEYPYIVYTVSYSRREWDGTNVSLITDVIVWSFSDDQVEAHTLDQLVNDSLEEVELDFSGTSTIEQSSLLCRRISDLSSFDLDGAGHRIFQMGGVYRIWTDQPRTA